MSVKNKFMSRALEIALKNVKTSTGGPFGCLIVQNNKIIAEATNTVTLCNDPTAHAEINAIRTACKKLKTFTLNKCELYTSCEPCPMCLSAIYWARIPKIYYAGTQKNAAKAGFDDAFLYKELKLSKDKRGIHLIQLMKNKGHMPFEAWIQSKTKIPY